jgi:hypothetical protein
MSIMGVVTPAVRRMIRDRRRRTYRAGVSGCRVRTDQEKSTIGRTIRRADSLTIRACLAAISLLSFSLALSTSGEPVR